MLSAAAIILIATSAAFTLWFTLVTIEQARGHRIVLQAVRRGLDRFLAGFAAQIRRTYEHFSKFVVQLGWYYSVHSFLRAILRLLIATYEYFESHFEQNRKRAKELRAERRRQLDKQRTHLTEMAEHKVETALSPAQQKKVKKDHLDGKV